MESFHFLALFFLSLRKEEKKKENWGNSGPMLAGISGGDGL
jgi:hypothetical protein